MKYAIYPKPVLGPCACQDCGAPLWWARRNTTVLHVIVGSLRWRDWNGRIHACQGRQRRYNGRLKGGRYPQIAHESVHHGLASRYNRGGRVRAEPNRLPAAAVASLLTPGDDGRAASGSKTDA